MRGHIKIFHPVYSNLVARTESTACDVHRAHGHDQLRTQSRDLAIQHEHDAFSRPISIAQGTSRQAFTPRVVSPSSCSCPVASRSEKVAATFASTLALPWAARSMMHGSRRAKGDIKLNSMNGHQLNRIIITSRTDTTRYSTRNGILFNMTTVKGMTSRRLTSLTKHRGSKVQSMYDGYASNSPMGPSTASRPSDQNHHAAHRVGGTPDHN